MLVARAGYGHIREVLLALFGGAEDLEEGGDGGVVVVPREVILRGTRLRRLHLAHLQEIGRCPGSDIVARGQQAIVALGQKAIVALGQKIVALGQTIVALGSDNCCPGSANCYPGSDNCCPGSINSCPG